MKSPVLELTGKIKGIGKTKTLKNDFKVRPLWLIYDDSYEHNGSVREKINTPEFQFTGKWCEKLDEFQAGDTVSLKFSIKGTKYTSKTTQKESVFTSLDAWGIEKAQNNEQQPEKLQVSELSDSDDLPF